MNQILMTIMAAGVVLGGTDRLLGNKFGYGDKFEEGFRLLGSTALSMAGMICLAPVLADVLGRIVVPLYRMIGADPACDIVVQDGEAALRHVRLFSAEDAVYVEALDVSGAAQVNGEGLREARRLRSGDEVTVGSTVIRLKF